MKKALYSGFLATSILAVSQLALAEPNIDIAQICPSIAELQKLPLKRVEIAQGSNRYNVSSDYQQTSDILLPYHYRSYAFYVRGVKATDAANAIKKVQDALSVAATEHPNATSIEPSSYSFSCIYPLDFSKWGDEYNGIAPKVVVEINSSDTQNLYALPEKLSIPK